MREARVQDRYFYAPHSLCGSQRPIRSQPGNSTLLSLARLRYALPSHPPKAVPLYSRNYGISIFELQSCDLLAELELSSLDLRDGDLVIWHLSRRASMSSNPIASKRDSDRQYMATGMHLFVAAGIF